MLTYLILALLGILAGLLAGLFGLGGGILFTPVLFIVFNDAGVSNPMLLAIGSSLFCTFIAATGSSWRQYRQQNFFWQEGWKVGILGAAGVTLGKWVITSPYYSQEEFVIFFSLLLFYVAVQFFRQGEGNDRESAGTEEEMPLRFGQVAVTGGLGGFVAALAGIGGGGVMVPLLNLWYKQSFKRAVSISSLAIVFISLSGWIQLAWTGSPSTLTEYHLGYVDFGAALPLAAGGLIGGFVGAMMNMKIRRKYLQVAFALLAIIMAVKLLSEVY